MMLAMNSREVGDREMGLLGTPERLSVVLRMIPPGQSDTLEQSIRQLCLAAYRGDDTSVLCERIREGIQIVMNVGTPEADDLFEELVFQL